MEGKRRDEQGRTSNPGEEFAAVVLVLVRVQLVIEGS